MNIKKNFLFYLSLIFFSTSLLNAEQIVYINIEKIMKESKAGKQIIEKITKSNELFEILNIDLSQITTWKFEKAGLVFLDPPYFSDLVEKALIKLKEIDAI